MSRIPITDGAGGYFWVPTDDQTGLDGSERPKHVAPRAPRASTSRMLRMVSQARYQAPQAPTDDAPFVVVGAMTYDPATDTLAQAHRPGTARAPRVPDPGTCLRRLADSVRLQDDGATSGP